MKTKILLAVTAMLMIALYATAEERSPGTGSSGYGYGSQQVVVNNYYYDNGYEYSSRLKRFHNSYTSFDFYSPLYTESYWYSFTPYTWGVSIYDDWYYYGAGVSRYSWRSGFGGSYWWGYDPWMDYDPWMGYGWNSWYSPGFSNGINIYLGRPQYHYPVAWNRWNYHQHWDSYRPVYIVNDNHYNTYINNNSYGRGYNPSRTSATDRRSGYTVVNGRSTGSNYTGPEGTVSRTGSTGTTGTGRAQGTRAGTGSTGTGRSQGTRAGTGNAENRGNSTGQGNRDKEKSNNGLRMGQTRRGVTDPTEAKPNEPARPNNPNVNDRIDPGREKAGTPARQQTEMRAPVPVQSRQKTQGTVKTTTRRETVVKSTEKSSAESTENKTSKTESGRRSTTAAKKR